MTLEEMELEPQEKAAGTLTVTHLAVVVDEETGEISRVPIRMVGPRRDPDFHLGAVSD